MVVSRVAGPDISFTVHHPVDINVLISCGGVAVLPGDVIVVPQQLAEEIAQEAAEMERKEEFILKNIDMGHSILGVYPSNEETLKEYEAWKQR